MSIDSVGLRLQSKAIDGRGLEALAGRPASRVVERGAPVSSRQPDGPAHQVSSAVFEQAGEWESLGEYVEALGPLLDRVRDASLRTGDVRADLTVAVSARGLGYVVSLDPAHLAALAAAKCGVLVDCYSPDGEEERPSAG